MKTSKTVQAAIRKVYQVNRTISGLQAAVEGAKAVIKSNGGGETDKLIATIEQVSAHVQNVQAHSRLVVRRK